MGAHTNPGGGASKKSDPVSGAASCHLTTEIGILTTLMMQSRRHFVVERRAAAVWEQWLAVAGSCWPVAGSGWPRGRRPWARQGWRGVLWRSAVEECWPGHGHRQARSGEVRCEVGGHSCDGRRYSSSSSSSTASEGPAASDADALSFLPPDEELEPFCEHVARAQR